jgi:hypothetical protein
MMFMPLSQRRDFADTLQQDDRFRAGVVPPWVPPAPKSAISPVARSEAARSMPRLPSDVPAGWHKLVVCTIGVTVALTAALTLGLSFVLTLTTGLHI